MKVVAGVEVEGGEGAMAMEVGAAVLVLAPQAGVGAGRG